MSRAAAGALAFLAAAACSKHDRSDAAPSAAPSDVASARVERGEPPDLSAAMAAADLRVEARRGVVKAGDPLLERHRARLESHFGGPTPWPLAFQAAPVTAGRTVLLLQATSGEGRPVVWLVDSSGEVLWTKEHPMGGVKPGASEPAIASGPEGRVALAWCNASTNSVALRQWADDGGAFADYEAMRFDACDALSVIYWPRLGWLMAVAWTGGATLQRIGENGEFGWGRDGIAMPWTYRGAARVSLALDTADSFMLFRLGRSGGEGSPEYVFASRWAPDGHALWPGPLSVKRLDPPPRDPTVRVALGPGADGAIRAAIPGPAEASFEVQSDGTVVRDRR